MGRRESQLEAPPPPQFRTGRAQPLVRGSFVARKRRLTGTNYVCMATLIIFSKIDFPLSSLTWERSEDIDKDDVNKPTAPRSHQQVAASS